MTPVPVRVKFGKRPAMFVGPVQNLLALLQPRFNPFWVPNAILSDYTFQFVQSWVSC